MKKLWIVLLVFIVVGIVPSLSMMNDSVLFSDALAKSLGKTFAVSALSSIGLLYKRNNTLGFGIAAAFFSVLILLAEARIHEMASKSEGAVAERGIVNDSALVTDPIENSSAVEAVREPQEEVPALDHKDVAAGVDRFIGVFHSGGFAATAEASRSCHEEVLGKPSLSSIDRCEAFDFAANQFAQGLAMMGGGSSDQFFGVDLTSDAVSLYAPLNLGPEVITGRVQAISVAVKTPGKKPITMGQTLDALKQASEGK